MPLRDPPRFLYVDETTAVLAWRSLVFTVWGRRALTVASATEQCRVCEAQAKLAGQGKLVEIVLLHPEAPVPDGPVRDVLDQSATRIAPYYACVATLFEGQGFRAAFIRGVLTSLQIVSRTKFAQKVFDDADACVAYAAMHAKNVDPNTAIEPVALAEAVASVHAMAMERGLWA